MENENSNINLSKLALALSKAQSDFKQIKKNKKASFKSSKGHTISYSYADLADVIEAIQPALSSNELSIIQKLEFRLNHFGLVTMLLHSSGASVETFHPLPDPKGLSPQDFGSRLTYARRYSTTSLVGVASDEDTDGEVPESKPQKKESKQEKKQEKFEEKTQEVTKPMMDRLYAIGAENGWKGEQINTRIKELYKIASSKDMTRAQYDQVVAGVQKYPRHNKVEAPSEPSPPDDYDQTPPEYDESYFPPPSDFDDPERRPEKKSDLRTPAQSYILEAEEPFEHLHGKTIAECDKDELKKYFDFLVFRSKQVPPPKGLRKIMEMQNKIGKFLVG